MLLPLLLALLATSQPDPLGTAVVQDGYSFRPPAAFRMRRLEPFHGTRALTASPVDGAQRFLSAALVDGSEPDAASLMVAVVEAPLSLEPATREALTSALVAHYGEGLGLQLTVESALLREGPSPRLEVLGTLRGEEAVRTVLVAVFPGEQRHAVVTVSVPPGRWESLRPVVGRALDSFRMDAPPGVHVPRGLAGAVAGGLLGALLASVALWRQRRRKG
jgi:hypothetical protein